MQCSKFICSLSQHFGVVIVFASVFLLHSLSLWCWLVQYFFVVVTIHITLLLEEYLTLLANWSNPTCHAQCLKSLVKETLFRWSSSSLDF